MSDLQIMCDLSPAALHARRDGLLAELLTRTDAHDALADGHRLRFAPSDDVLSTIARVIDAERQCCRFLRFHLIVEPDNGPIILELTGPAGTREFLATLLESR